MNLFRFWPTAALTLLALHPLMALHPVPADAQQRTRLGIEVQLLAPEFEANFRSEEDREAIRAGASQALAEVLAEQYGFLDFVPAESEEFHLVLAIDSLVRGPHNRSGAFGAWVEVLGPAGVLAEDFLWHALTETFEERNAGLGEEPDVVVRTFRDKILAADFEALLEHAVGHVPVTTEGAAMTVESAPQTIWWLIPFAEDEVCLKSPDRVALRIGGTSPFNRTLVRGFEADVEGNLLTPPRNYEDWAGDLHSRLPEGQRFMDDLRTAIDDGESSLESVHVIHYRPGRPCDPAAIPASRVSIREGGGR